MNYRCRGMYRGKICNRLLFIGEELKGSLEIRCPRCGNDMLVVDGEVNTIQNNKKIV